jgi:RNA polymerase sigma factor (sigma-70 family)
MKPPTPPDGTLPPDQIFLAHLKLIEKIAEHCTRRYYFQHEEAEDFISIVKCKLIEDDYKVIRKFKGESSFATYLNVVIQRLLLDHLDHLWGKWRPCAEAKRLGPVAILLDKLLAREGHTLMEACQILIVNYKVPESEKDLIDIATKISPRSHRRSKEGEEVLQEMAGEDHADDGIVQEERETLARAVTADLQAAISSLPAQDQLIVRMLLEKNFSVVGVARTMALEQKPLYSRVKKIYEKLRQFLEGREFSSRDILEIIGKGGL